MNFKKIKLFLPFLISIICIISLTFLINPYQLTQIVSEINIFWLILAISLLLPNIYLRVIRWNKIINIGKMKYKFNLLTKIYLIGQALNLFLPGSLGDIGKFYFGVKKENDKLLMLGSSFIDKLYGVISLLILGIISTVLIGELNLLFLELVFFTILVILISQPLTIIKILRKLKIKNNKIKKLIHYLKYFRETLKIFKISMVYSFLGWFFTIVIYMILFKSFQIDVDYYTIIVIVPIIYIIRILPISIAGIGTTDLFTVYFLQNDYISTESLLSLSIVANIVLVIIPGIVGIYFLITHKGHKNEKSE